MRRFIGNLLALVGIAAVVVNVWQPWYKGVEERRIDVGFLFGGSTYATGSLWHSMFVAALVVAAVGVLGILAQSRMLLGLSGLAGIAMVVLWAIFRTKANGSAHGLNVTDFDSGLWATLAGSVVLWFAAAVLPGRRRAAVE
ncbi:hypothetical protein BIV57_12075 [Mangrovactinospora gilvigrisea]|uniref:Uncharacterized protein n=1 Tax=Mangrovactinospora gilvigrisea TaxID=1428644 RepID=A0A1J7BF94_9ACTN|nr:hypothetical protein [Mangrovactinospora gilvigrisea]OIV37245.1 hypothetical protein BIV57_12075 [Mangrovactinospora gilvigrisea]